MAHAFHCAACNPTKQPAGLRLTATLEAPRVPSCPVCRKRMQPTDEALLAEYGTERGRPVLPEDMQPGHPYLGAWMTGWLQGFRSTPSNQQKSD